MSNKKKRLTKDQEFEILKLVLDKFLLIGFGVMGYGLFKILHFGTRELLDSLLIIAGGAVILLVLVKLIIKEFEFFQ